MLSVGLGLAWAFYARSQAWQQFDALRDMHAASKRGVVPADLLGRHQHLDPVKQKELNRLLAELAEDTRFVDFVDLASRLYDDDMKSFLHGEGPLPTDVPRRLDDVKEPIDRILDLLRTDQVVIGALGELVVRGEDIEEYLRMAGWVGSASLLIVHSLGTYFKLRALVDEDPLRALANLAVLERSMFHPVSTLDLSILHAVMSARDEAWIRCCHLGRVDRAAAASWLAEVPAWRQAIVSGLKGERILFTVAIGEAVRKHGIDEAMPRQGGLWGESRESWNLDVFHRWQCWIHAGSEFAETMRAQVVVADYYRGLPGTSADDLIGLGEEFRFDANKQSCELMLTTVGGFQDQVAQGYAHRLAACLIFDRKDGLPLPGSLSACRERYPDLVARLMGVAQAELRVADGEFIFVNLAPMGLLPEWMQEHFGTFPTKMPLFDSRLWP